MNFSSPQRLFSNSFFQELVELRAIKLPLCFSVLSKDLTQCSMLSITGKSLSKLYFEIKFQIQFGWIYGSRLGSGVQCRHRWRCRGNKSGSFTISQPWRRNQSNVGLIVQQPSNKNGHFIYFFFIHSVALIWDFGLLIFWM